MRVVLARDWSTVIDDPRWTMLRMQVANSVSSASSKRMYRAALDQFYTWHFTQLHPSFCKAVVLEYRTVLEARRYSASTISLHLCAIKKLAVEATDSGLLDAHVASSIARVHSPRRLGRRVGKWLGVEQVVVLINIPDVGTLKGIRDRALLVVAVGCGLRRSEIANLTLAQLQVRDDRYVFADLIGKHGRIRTVPIPRWAMPSLDCWVKRAGVTSGNLFRSVRKGSDSCGQRMSSQAVYEVVKTYASRAGFRIAPHDLRRTHAKLAYAGEAPIEQIQYCLGHGSLITTERYLGLEQDLRDAPGDHIVLPL